MSMMSNIDIERNRVVEALKACGQCIVDNAESMVGYELYRSGLSVTIDILDGEAPVIHINRDVYPEALVECGRNEDNIKDSSITKLKTEVDEVDVLIKTFMIPIMIDQLDSLVKTEKVSEKTATAVIEKWKEELYGSEKVE